MSIRFVLVFSLAVAVAVAVTTTSKPGQGRKRGPPRRRYLLGRMCRADPASCQMVIKAAPMIVQKLKENDMLKDVTKREALMLARMVLKKEDKFPQLKTEEEAVQKVLAGIMPALKPVPGDAPTKRLASIAAVITRNTPSCYSVTGIGLLPAWTAFVNLKRNGDVSDLAAALDDFQMTVQTYAALDAARRKTISLPRFMKWINMYQKLQKSMQCGAREHIVS